MLVNVLSWLGLDYFICCQSSQLMVPYKVIVRMRGHWRPVRGLSLPLVTSVMKDTVRLFLHLLLNQMFE